MIMPLVLACSALLAVSISWSKDRDRTLSALKKSLRSLLALVRPILAMTAMVGLTLALIPPAQLSKLFAVHGTIGFVLIALVGAMVTMPAPIAFPLAGTLLGLGVSLSALAAFITTLTMVGIVTAPLEAQHFGRRFTWTRQALSFALALAIGGIMGEVL